MMMSVFRQGGHTQQLDHEACIGLAVDDEAIQMILFSRLHNKPTLVGLSDGQAIIKPLEADDSKSSFEALFDTCVSLREYRRLIQHRKTATEDLLPYVFEVNLVVEVDFRPSVRLRMVAKNDAELRKKLHALLTVPTEENIAFREGLTLELARQIFASDDVKVSTAGGFRVGEATGEEPEWQIVERPS